MGWSHDSTADPTGLSRTADAFTAQSLSKAQYDRDQDQANRSPAELVSDAMVDAPQEADSVETDEVEFRLHSPQLSSEQWQRAEFLIDYAVAAINRIRKHQIENNAYWAAWDEDEQHLVIGRKSNQAAIVKAHFKDETEQWKIELKCEHGRLAGLQKQAAGSAARRTRVLPRTLQPFCTSSFC